MGFISKVPKIVKKAKSDSEFINNANSYISDFRTPSSWTDRDEQVLFALLYIGYLLGRHQDDPEKYI